MSVDDWRAIGFGAWCFAWTFGPCIVVLALAECLRLRELRWARGRARLGVIRRSGTERARVQHATEARSTARDVHNERGRRRVSR